MNVLLIEDDKIDQLHLRSILLDAYPEIELSIAESISDAKGYLDQNRYDLIMSDYYLNEESLDYRMLNKLNSINTPVIITSGRLEYEFSKTFNKLDHITFIDKLDINNRTLQTVFTKQINGAKRQITLMHDAELLKKKVEILDLFTSGISHDLKNPLNSIIGLVDYLEKELATDEEKVEVLNIIKRSAHDINETLNTLLNYVKLDYTCETDDSITSKKHIQTIYDEVKGQFSKSVVNFNINGNALINAPQVAFDIIFKNLISNSIKYKTPNRPLDITVDIRESYNDGVTIIYSDNGLGFTEENKGDIFLAFKRLNSSKDTKGHGIGMTLVKKSIELCHATIDYESTPGVGTTFYMKFSK
ncbi:hybrid sensor histidine kinase/response regulator [Bacteriovorax sp. Seq25_V]|uniref:ATP-binding response regulator n=1 Tax=Bacteriovorax sp. Seq25_V TaxID=1201288 RepID=UPI000552EB98|nr:hybrid sensor histidine kinase/response regulator [Bacteriovorax sp. Seq25_V]